ncbi:1-(5-phosphoribosyl)-5-[(5-phosphoribosylamino)methylideneamino] imidazole-4-carboxamide isomerase chloroplastic [Euphorbia peplus]|nr:1-(5-phosphoribosyl)-5-[(5-phosphoribosylamino)methylideneamino] imidazole-4-carboxamide isomerase chloroplastic [Euphorbia peplus]
MNMYCYIDLFGFGCQIPVTYAGVVTVVNDLERIKAAGKGRVDVMVGNAHDNLPYKDVVAWHTRQEALTA